MGFIVGLCRVVIANFMGDLQSVSFYPRVTIVSVRRCSVALS